MQPESSPRFEEHATEVAELRYTPADLRSAEAVDTALAAAATGVDAAAIRRAWGDEAGALTELAERLAPATARAVPSLRPAFVGGLERRVADAFDAQPARRRRAWSLPRFGRLTEMTLVGAAAVALAAGAFLLSPGRGLAPYSTPTAEAATEAATGTATLATPEVQVTRSPEDGVSGAKAASAPLCFTDGLSTPHAPISEATDTGSMNTTAATLARNETSQDWLAMLPLATSGSRRWSRQPHAAPAGRIDAPGWAYAAAADWSLAWPDPAIHWNDAPAPLPSPATVEAGKRRLMALAERLQAERRTAVLYAGASGTSQGIPNPPAT